MPYDIRVTDKRPKAVVRHMLCNALGPRDPAGRDAIFAEWWGESDQFGYSHTRFIEFMRSQDWTLGEMMSYLAWQAVSLDGTVDEKEFTREWAIVKSIFARYDLLSPEWIVRIDGRPTSLRAAAAQDLAVLEL